jgi:hypothetical protein
MVLDLPSSGLAQMNRRPATTMPRSDPTLQPLRRPGRRVHPAHSRARRPPGPPASSSPGQQARHQRPVHLRKRLQLGTRRVRPLTGALLHQQTPRPTSLIPTARASRNRTGQNPFWPDRAPGPQRPGSGRAKGQHRSKRGGRGTFSRWETLPTWRRFPLCQIRPAMHIRSEDAAGEPRGYLRGTRCSLRTTIEQHGEGGRDTG